MERLTNKLRDVLYDVISYTSQVQDDIINAAVGRLEAYEDTGLTPDKVKDMAENAETRLLTWFEARYGIPVGELIRMCEEKLREQK